MTMVASTTIAEVRSELIKKVKQTLKKNQCLRGENYLNIHPSREIRSYNIDKPLVKCTIGDVSVNERTLPTMERSRTPATRTRRTKRANPEEMGVAYPESLHPKPPHVSIFLYVSLYNMYIYI